MRASALRLAVALALGGCTLINPTAEFLPSDVLDGGTSDAAIADAAFLDAAPSDAAADDAALADAAPSDAGSDAGAPDACATYSLELEPVATGAASFAPELGTREVNAAGDLIVSDYVRTTMTNRNFRRGIMEFELPAEAARASAASLVFRLQNAPSEAHVVYAYSPANGLVDINDYDRSALPAGVITVDAIEYEHDVLEHVTRAGTEPLGFRVQLAPPFDNAMDFTSRGIVVQSPRLVLTLPCGD